MPDPIPPVCVWLKRDLRVRDHAALATAVARARGGAVFAVFLYEPEVLAQPEWDPSHTEFQRECLADLDTALARLGIRLVTRRGEAVAALERLRTETGFRLLVAHEETGTGVTYARDRRVRRWARAAEVEFVELPQTGVVRRLASRDGWNRLWENRMGAAEARVSRSGGHGGRTGIARLDTAGILGCRELGQPPDTKDRQPGGERAAHDVLDDFLARRGRGYAGGISSPLGAVTNCSRLSPALGVLPGMTLAVFAGSALVHAARRRGGSLHLESNRFRMELRAADARHEVLDLGAPIAAVMLCGAHDGRRMLVLSQRE